MTESPVNPESSALPALHCTGKAEASFYAWVGGGGGTLCLRCQVEQLALITVVPPRGRPQVADWSESMSLATPGVWAVTVRTAEAVTFCPQAEGEVYPFVIPGPGIVPSHFPQPQPTLLFARGADVAVWLDVPDDLPMVTLGAWIPPGHEVSLTFPAGGKPDAPCVWRPERPSAYRLAEVDARGRGGWWGLRLARGPQPFRLTVLEGLPLFLRKPTERFPYGRVSCRAKGPKGSCADARFECFHGRSRLALRDAADGRPAVLHVPPGKCTVRASRGIELEPQSKRVTVRPGKTRGVSFRLRQVLQPPPGWVCGDLHTHSCFEDGGQSPRAVAQAARAGGLGFVFLTDVPEPLEAAGLADFNAPGEFLALPGEEAATDAVHMNFLNTRQGVLRASQYVADWLDNAAAQSSPEHPTAAMLNHPAHLPEMQRRHAYFRSWWAADEHESVGLVENFDFASWYERLNRGRRLTGVWTTDTHDTAFLPPGRKRTYVHVGEDFDEASLMAALRQGRCFCTRQPGAMLLLEANGASIGSTAQPDQDGAVTVHVTCHAACPIERVELIADGGVAGVWHGRNRMELDATVRLRATMRWLIARTFVTEEPWPKDGHCMEALMASGCVAFTNPVWVEQAVPPAAQ